MKLTKAKLQQIIKEELQNLLERPDDEYIGDTVVPQELGAEAEPQEYPEKVNLGKRGPTDKQQFIQAAEMLKSLIDRDLKEDDMTAIYDIATYIENFGTPDNETLSKIVPSDININKPHRSSLGKLKHTFVK